MVGARLIISGMCDSHLLISVLKPLYGLEICLLLVSVFKYIAEHFDKRVNATMYLLGYQAMLYVGNVVVSSLPAICMTVLALSTPISSWAQRR